jgi:SAM-dependent methyltransferase
MDLRAHQELLRRQFAVQAKAHPRTVRYRRVENVVPMIELARPGPSDRMLDVASGWGFVCLAFAPHVKSAVGVDLTPEMVELARKVAAERQVANVEYSVGEAEDLRFGPGSFEIVSCRFTFHHFGDPERALFEMKRVLTPDGRIVLYDCLASSDERKAKVHNAIELARDPSHVRMYTDREFHAFFRKCGLEPRGRIVTLMKRHFEHWMDFVDADATTRRRVKRMLEDTADGNRAGLGVRTRGGELTFTHTCVAWLLTPK